jgi:hypothetical protein
MPAQEQEAQEAAQRTRPELCSARAHPSRVMEDELSDVRGPQFVRRNGHRSKSLAQKASHDRHIGCHRPRRQTALSREVFGELHYQAGLAALLDLHRPQHTCSTQVLKKLVDSRQIAATNMTGPRTCPEELPSDSLVKVDHGAIRCRN